MPRKDDFSAHSLQQKSELNSFDEKKLAGGIIFLSLGSTRIVKVAPRGFWKSSYSRKFGK